MLRNRDLTDNLGKLPPQDLELERGVLGGIMMESKNHKCLKLVEIIQPEHFYSESHVELARAITEIHRQEITIDLRVIVHQLKKMGKLEIVGGAYYLAELLSSVSGTDNIETHYRIIIELWMRRELINLAGQINQTAYDDSIDVFNIVDSAAAMLQKINPYTETE